jgi:hypothetical protein
MGVEGLSMQYSERGLTPASLTSIVSVNAAGRHGALEPDWGR